MINFIISFIIVFFLIKNNQQWKYLQKCKNISRRLQNHASKYRWIIDCCFSTNAESIFMRSPFSPLSKRIEGGKLMQTGHLWCSTPVGATSISTRIRDKYIADKNDCTFYRRFQPVRSKKECTNRDEARDTTISLITFKEVFRRECSMKQDAHTRNNTIWNPLNAAYRQWR